MPETERDYGYEAQQAAEKHLAALDAELMGWEELDQEPQQAEPAAGPYCGCTTCQVRETLHAAWPIIEEYVRNNPI